LRSESTLTTLQARLVDLLLPKIGDLDEGTSSGTRMGGAASAVAARLASDGAKMTYPCVHLELGRLEGSTRTTRAVELLVAKRELILAVLLSMCLVSVSQANGVARPLSACPDNTRQPVSPKAVLGLVARQQPVFLSDVHITGDLDLDSATGSLATKLTPMGQARVLKAPLVIIWSTICGSVRSTRPLIFESVLDLSATSIFGKLVMIGTTFESDLKLRRTNFGGQVFLQNQTFRGTVNMSFANRGWDPQSTGLTWSLDIDRAVFERPLVAQDAWLPRTTWIRDVTFNEGADFARTRFSGSLVGERLSVSRHLDLSYAAFEDIKTQLALSGGFSGLNLYGASLPAEVNLRGAVFSGEVDARVQRYPKHIHLSPSSVIDLIKVDWAGFDDGRWWLAWFGAAPALRLTVSSNSGVLSPIVRFLRAAERYLRDSGQIAESARVKYRLVKDAWCGVIGDQVFGCWLRWMRVFRNAFFLWFALGIVMFIAKVRKTRGGEWKLQRGGIPLDVDRGTLDQDLLPAAVDGRSVWTLRDAATLSWVVVTGLSLGARYGTASTWPRAAARSGWFLGWVLWTALLVALAQASELGAYVAKLVGAGS